MRLMSLGRARAMRLASTGEGSQGHGVGHGDVALDASCHAAVALDALLGASSANPCRRRMHAKLNDVTLPRRSPRFPRCSPRIACSTDLP